MAAKAAKAVSLEKRFTYSYLSDAHRMLLRLIVVRPS
jgi:hypothetical protein